MTYITDTPMKYLHCDRCAERQEPGQYFIGVTDNGDLHLVCQEHTLENAGPFMVFKNEEIAERLRGIASQCCGVCKGECGGVH